jgi:PAS domain S-box-containing protein
MKVENKTKRQLIDELEELRQRIGELEKSETERERAEDALRESERKYRGLVDNSIVGIYRTNLAGKILYVNEALARMLKFDPPEEIMSEGVLARYKNHKDRERLLEILNKSGSVDSFEFDLFTRKGETITALLSAVLDQDIISGMIMDISERKRAEEALRESEERYSSLFKNNHSVMLLIDPESADIVDANPAACSFYGWSLEELTSMKITDINMLPNEQVLQEIERAKSEARYHSFFRHRLANDEVRAVEVFSGPIRLHGKELLYSIIHDISKRKRAEEALRKEEEKYRILVEESPLGVSIIDEEGHYKYVNPKFVEICGYDLEDIPTGREWFRKAYPDEEYRKQAISDWIADLKKAKRGEARPRALVVRCKDDSDKVIYFRPVTMASGDQFVIYEDITDQKRSEEALRISEADLLEKSRHLEEVNAALKVLLKRREDDKAELEENLLINVKELVLPYLEKLKKSHLDPHQITLVSILESHLRDVVSPFTNKLSSRFLNLTPTEIQVANLIREGQTNKEIADLLYLSVNTIRSHRFRIRSKLELTNKKINLRTYLKSLQNE